MHEFESLIDPPAEFFALIESKNSQERCWRMHDLAKSILHGAEVAATAAALALAISKRFGPTDAVEFVEALRR